LNKSKRYLPLQSEKQLISPRPEHSLKEKVPLKTQHPFKNFNCKNKQKNPVKKEKGIQTKQRKHPIKMKRKQSKQLRIQVH
jgi:hypothetical protein